MFAPRMRAIYMRFARILIGTKYDFMIVRILVSFERLGTGAFVFCGFIFSISWDLKFFD